MIDSKVTRYRRHLEQKNLPKPPCCQICYKSSRLRWHGRYTRHLITWTKIYELPIRRLFCALCRHTFGLLPSFVVKFHRYAKEVIRAAVTWLKTQTYEAVAERISNRFPDPGAPNLATLTLYFWRLQFGLPNPF